MSERRILGGVHHTEKVITIASDGFRSSQGPVIWTSWKCWIYLQRPPVDSWQLSISWGKIMIRWSIRFFLSVPCGSSKIPPMMNSCGSSMWYPNWNPRPKWIQWVPMTSVTSVTKGALLHLDHKVTATWRQPGLWKTLNICPLKSGPFGTPLFPLLYPGNISEKPIFTYNYCPIRIAISSLWKLWNIVKLSWHDHHFIIQTPMILVYLHISTHPNSRRKTHGGPFLAMTCFA